ncbi:MAG: hypothetical protein Q8T09_06505 [Candidatus Melainabacteria bacterium]|nr:hypothetical protein [Candidatus Melainabacteria bacterium]
MLLGPWLFLTKTLTGQFHLIPERVPSYNFAVGNNLNTDGRASLPPEPQAVRLSALNAPLKILKAAWSERPLQLSNLYVRKVPRILGFVWNDFRQNVFGLDIDKQNFVHGIILAMAFMGLAYITFELVGSTNVYEQPRKFYLILIPTVFLIHVLLYLPFEAITRYGATAQPFLFLAASFGVLKQASRGRIKFACFMLLALIVVAVMKLESTCFLFDELDFGVAIFVLTILKVVVLLIAIASAILLGAANSTELSKLSQPRKVIVSLLICAVLFLVITPVTFTCLFRDDQRECLLELLPGEILDREFLVTGDSKSLSHWLVYIDCDGRFEDAQFWVNGHKLSGQLVSANRFDSARYYLYNVARMYSSILDLGPDNLRQWRVLKIPSEFIRSRPGASTRLTVKAGALGLTIYADRYGSDEDQIFLPDRKYFGSTRLSCGGAALEPRLLSTLPTPLFDVPADLNSQGVIRKLIGSQPRFYALRAVPSSNLEWLKREFSVPLSAKSFPAVMQSSEGAPGFVDLIKLDRYIFKLSPTTSLTTKLPAYFANNMPIEIILNGQIRSTGRVSKAGVFVTMHGNRVESTSMILPSSPPFVSASSSWKPFAIRDQVFVGRSYNDDALLTVTVFPGRWEQISQYGLDRTVGSFQFKELSLLVRSLEPFDLNQMESTLY